MLQEYMKRLILEQPEDPLKFLIHSITVNPYVVNAVETLTANTSTFEPQQESTTNSYSEDTENFENPELDG